MLLIRLLPVLLVVITNTWLLSPVRSVALSRHKRSLSRRADGELSRIAAAGEPCFVSPSRPQPRALSPTQHRPPAAPSRTSTSRKAPYAVKGAQEICPGGCGLDTELQGVAPAGRETEGRGDTDDLAGRAAGHPTSFERVYGNNFRNEERESNHVGEDVQHPPGRSDAKDTEGRVSPSFRSRVSRSLDAKLRDEKENDSRWEKVSPDVHRGPQVLHRPRQDDDNQSSTMTLEQAGATEDYFGEVEEEDAAADFHVDSWGTSLPRVPPSWMTALYFSGHREQLKVKLAEGVKLPRDKFSLELWVKPEGGQSNPAVIAGGCK